MQLLDSDVRTFTTTDTHGCNEELRECLELAGFRYDKDVLIHIGDCTDRGPDSYGVIETLLSIKNLIAIRGNHDSYIETFIKTGYHPWEHGSHHTLLSYINGLELPYPEIKVHYRGRSGGAISNFTAQHMPITHRNFFLHTQVDYYVDSQNRLFVHGGYDPMEKIEEQHSSFLSWDRELVQHLASFVENDKEPPAYADVNFFKRVFVGHTPTLVFKKFIDRAQPFKIWKPEDANFTEPMYMAQLVNLDTGCCFGGKLSVIDITDDDNHILYQVAFKGQV
jgi:serine/threonine protein phosphatase 1